jgi:uncharacterized membrane protein
MEPRTRTLLISAGAIGVALFALSRRDRDVTADRAHASRTVTIRSNPNHLYNLWMQPEQQKRLFGETEMEIVDATQGQRFEWRTPQHAPYRGGGSLTFAPAPGDRGTHVRLALFLEGPGAHAIAAFERLTGRSPAQLAMETLRDFKALVEAGEIPQAQSSPQAVSA